MLHFVAPKQESPFIYLLYIFNNLFVLNILYNLNAIFTLYIICNLYSVKARPPHVSSSRRLGNQQRTLFNVLCVTEVGFLPTLFLAYVCSPIYSVLRQLGFCRLLCRGSSSPADLQHGRLRSEGGKEHDTFFLPSLSKGLLAQGP